MKIKELLRFLGISTVLKMRHTIVIHLVGFIILVYVDWRIAVAVYMNILLLRYFTYTQNKEDLRLRRRIRSIEFKLKEKSENKHQSKYQRKE